jgi:hypothetical protein
MRRSRFAAASAVVFAVAAVVGATGASGGPGDDGRYLVRAEFDNASFITTGENVKVSGVTVGTVHALDVTPDHDAVLILQIDDPAFRPFRRDAHCRIGLQSLIGEQFVECEPTTPRGGDRAPAPELPKITSGAGKGQYLLPVAQNSSPVGADLLNNIMRVPQRQRLPLIINEFGAGLSGNGESLRAAIRRASPALQQADKLVQILAEQDKTLSRLVAESDAVLGPMAAHRRDLTGFLKHAGQTATAGGRRARGQLREVPGFPAPARPGRRPPRRSGRPDDARDPGAGRAGARRQRGHGAPRPARQAVDAGADDVGQGRRPRTQDVPGDRCPREPARRARDAAAAAGQGPRRAVVELRQDGRHREPDAVHLLLHRRRER